MILDRFDVLAPDDLRLAEEIPLEQLEPHFFPPLRTPGASRSFRPERRAAAPRPRGVDELPGPVHGGLAKVDLDDVGQFDEGLELGAEQEIVQRHGIPGGGDLPARGDQVRIGGNVLEDLHHQVLSRKHGGDLFEQQVPGEVDE